MNSTLQYYKTINTEFDSVRRKSLKSTQVRGKRHKYRIRNWKNFLSWIQIYESNQKNSTLVPAQIKSLNTSITSTEKKDKS